jgi:uncharacterized protein (TIGR02646 family)
MKYIVKGDEPEELQDWKAQANEDWQPTYADLRGNEKTAVKNCLMAEQGYICCYCERRLLDSDSHIEHLLPQSDPAVDPLEYGNMLCSCQDQVKKGEPRHCGNLKEDKLLPVTPLVDNCEEQFAFTYDGQIQPVPGNNGAAKKTIAILGLDIPKLNDLRKNAIDPFLDEDLEETELADFVTGYLEKDDRGKFGEFWSTINYLFVR